MKKDSLLTAFAKHELTDSDTAKLLGGSAQSVYTVVGYDGGGTTNSTVDVQGADGVTHCGWPDVLCGTFSPSTGITFYSSIAV